MRDFSFRGQYSKYAKFLFNPIENKYGSFTILSRLIDVYIFSAIYGYLNNAFEEYDSKVENDVDRDEISTVKQAVFINNNKFPIVRKIILINENKSGRSPSERIDSVFRYDYEYIEDSQYEKNSKIMEGYVLGGLRKLYDKFKDVRTEEDCAKLMYDMVHEFAGEVNIEEPMKD